MTLRNGFELSNTQQKLAELEAHYLARSKEPVTNVHTRELSLRSLKRLINQLKEEIARYNAHALRR